MTYRLRTTAEIGQWLAGLWSSEPVVAAEVTAALTVLMDSAQLPGPPMVTDTSRPEPADPREHLDLSYRQMLEALQHNRRLQAEASAQRVGAERMLAELRQAAEADPAQLSALESAVARESDAEHALAERGARMQAAVDSFRTRKETVKALYTAAEAGLAIQDAAGAGELQTADEELAAMGREVREAAAELANSRAEAVRLLRRLHPVTLTQDEELAASAADPADPDAPPVLELHADPLGADVSLLFIADPSGTLTVLAVLEGPDAVDSHWQHAVAAVQDLAGRIRAQGWPEDLGPELACASADELLAGVAPGHRVAVTQRAAAIRAATPLAELRAAQGRSLAELAGLAGLSEEALASLERDGLRDAPVAEVAAYVRALGGRLELTAILDGDRSILS